MPRQFHERPMDAALQLCPANACSRFAVALRGQPDRLSSAGAEAQRTESSHTPGILSERTQFLQVYHNVFLSSTAEHEVFEDQDIPASKFSIISKSVL